MSKKINSFKNLNFDGPAGLVVFLVALPLCLGVALASTNDSSLLFSGIISGAVGGILVGILSGSSLGVSGPAAGLVTIVLGAITDLGSFQLFLLAVVLAGLIQLIAGFLRAGVIAYYFPSSVIKGMLAAIGIILILKQFPHAMGFDKNFEGDESFMQKDGHNTFTELYYAVKYSSVGAVIIAITSMGLLILFDRPFIKKIGLFKFLPGALFVVVVGVLINLFYQSYIPAWYLSGEHVVQLPVPDSPSDILNFFTFPDWSGFTNYKVYIVAFTIAIIASIETLLSVEATDKLDPYKRITPTNRELKAQGVGNAISGLIGGLPITQVIVRSSANINSGGRTKMATIIHGVILLLSAIIIPQFLNYIPLSALAAILLMVGYKLAKPSLFVGMYKLGWEQFFPFLITIVAVVGTDLLKGIFLGMVVAIGFIIANYQKLKFENTFRNIFHAFDVKKETNKVSIKLSREVNFFNKGAISKMLSELPEGTVVEIDGEDSVNIDFDVLEIIQEFQAFAAETKNIQVITKGIKQVTAVGGH
jgi:MFS superfamily sulfate permease-like transporter